jgi:hypothetical protein
VRNPVSTFAFKWVNLYRYAEGCPGTKPKNGPKKIEETEKDQKAWSDLPPNVKAGLYKLNPLDPQLETAWFQPSNLSS